MVHSDVTSDKPRESGLDWRDWHNAYDEPGSSLARRLTAVRTQIRTALARCGPGPIRAVSLCAGQGRDLLGVLADHPRRHDVRAVLVELDPDNADLARTAAARLGLGQVRVVTGDAGLADHYVGAAPADLVLVCGVFGNISDADIERTIDACRQLCQRGGTVIWTRHRGAPDRAPLICRWFEQRGFVRLWLSDPDVGYGVGAHRFHDTPTPLRAGERWFDFVGHDALTHSEPATDE